MPGGTRCYACSGRCCVDPRVLYAKSDTVITTYLRFLMADTKSRTEAQVPTQNPRRHTRVSVESCVYSISSVHSPSHDPSHQTNAHGGTSGSYSGLPEAAKIEKALHTHLSHVSYMLTPHQIDCKSNGTKLSGPRVYASILLPVVSRAITGVPALVSASASTTAQCH